MCEGAKRPSPSERSERGGRVPPPTVRAFCHFDVVNGAIWCICPEFSSHSTNLYLLLLSKWLKGGSFTCIHATLFSFIRSLSLSPFLAFFFGGGGGATAPPPPPPPGYAPGYNMSLCWLICFVILIMTIPTSRKLGKNNYENECERAKRAESFVHLHRKVTRNFLNISLESTSISSIQLCPCVV